MRWEFLRFLVPEAVLLIGLHRGLEGSGFLVLVRFLGLVPVGRDEDDADAEAEAVADAAPLAVVAVVVVMVPDADVDEVSEVVNVSRLVAYAGRLRSVRSVRGRG